MHNYKLKAIKHGNIKTQSNKTLKHYINTKKQLINMETFKHRPIKHGSLINQGKAGFTHIKQSSSIYDFVTKGAQNTGGWLQCQ